MDAKLGLIDMRILGKQQGSLAWIVEKSHDGPITDVQFNPFIPYWFASSSRDGSIKMWDIRYISSTAHVGRIDGHFDGVETIAWSNTHADVISSGSSDRSWSCWSWNGDLITCKKPSKDILIGFPGSEVDPMHGLGDRHSCIGASKIGDSDKCYQFPIVSGIAITF